MEKNCSQDGPHVTKESCFLCVANTHHLAITSALGVTLFPEHTQSELTEKLLPLNKYQVPFLSGTCHERRSLKIQIRCSFP